MPNDVQTAYLDLLHQDYPAFDWRNDVYTLRGMREDVLKFRQPGISTLWLILYFIDTINNPLTETVIYAHDGEGTEKLFQIVHRLYTHLPKHKKRPIKYSSKKELVFSDIDSGLYVGVVGGKTLGRGGTTNNCHESERAWSDNFAELEVGLFQAVPADGNITRETTANGLNEYFQERQEVRAGRSVFKPRFFAAYQHAEYKMPVPSNFVRTQEEDALIMAYGDKGLDNGFLVWRRSKMSESAAMQEKFDQEFPVSEEVAFLTSGNNYFNRKRLNEMLQQLEENSPEAIDDLVFDPTNLPYLRKLYDEGKFVVWEMPEPDHVYIVSADPAGGLNTNGDSDYCSSDILDADTMEQVAVLHGRWEPHQFGKMLAELGWMYGEALVGVLRMNHGHAVLDALLQTEHYPPQKGNGFSGVYFFDPAQITAQTKHPDTRTRQAGWPENMMTKPYMLDKLAEAILMEPGLRVNSRDSLREMLTYIHLPGGAAGGEKGSHDDRVSSLALAAALRSLRFERTTRNRQHIEPVEPKIRYGRQERFERR